MERSLAKGDWSKMRQMTQLVPAQKAACVATFAKPPAAAVATTAVWLSLARRSR